MIDNIGEYRIGIIGGGSRCKALLDAVFIEDLQEKQLQILGVADTDAQAVGVQFAREKGIYTTTDFKELFSIEELDLLLELTHDESLREVIRAGKPPGVLLADHHEARAILDDMRIRARKAAISKKLPSCRGDIACIQALLDEFHDFVQTITRDANTYAHETRQHLVSSEWTVTQILSGSPIPKFVIDKNHIVTHWNLACERLTGYSANRMIGTDHHWKPFRSEKQPTMADLIIEGISEDDLWKNYGTNWGKSALIDGAYEVEEFFPNLGESGRWLFFTAVPLRAPDGTVLGAIETIWDRTARKNAEMEREVKNRELALKVEELSAKEQTMSQIINGSTIPTFVIGRDHNVTHWNKALERLTGQSAQETIGTSRQWGPFYEHERPSMADVILDQVDESKIKSLYGDKWRKSLLIKGAYEAEVFFPRMGDGGKWCWFTAAPIKSPEGEVVGAIETIWDKTEERKAEKERERHTLELAAFCSIYATLSGQLSLEGRIREAIDETAGIFMLDGLCIFILKPDGKFHLRYSSGYSDRLCFENRVAENDSIVAKVAEEGAVAVYDKLQEIKDEESEIGLLGMGGFKSLVYLPLLDKEKKAFGVMRAGRKRPTPLNSNEVRALELIANRVGVAIENALLQTDLQRRSNFQARLIESSNDGIVAVDDKWTIVIFNPAAESIFGLNAVDVIGKINARTLYPDTILNAFDDILTPDAAQGNIRWQETRIIANQGDEIPVRFSGTMLRGKHKMLGAVAFFHDLREIKRLEKELLASERLAAVGQTTAGMAHCVKNILHGLKGGSYMVNTGIEKNNTEKLKAGWNMVQRNIARTSDLVQDLLSYSKEREPEPGPCEPNEIVVEVCDLMREVAKAQDVEISMSLSDDIGIAILDCRSLHRCLLNLVSNAIDACRDDPAPDKHHMVRVTSILEARTTLRFDVADNGSGMSDEVKNKLFTSFFSTKGPKGTGLGLLVTRKLIEEHKGEIVVESELGQGTTFSVKLPFQQE